MALLDMGYYLKQAEAIGYFLGWLEIFSAYEQLRIHSIEVLMVKF